MTEDSTFGAKPERLRRLLLVAREKPEEQPKPTASWDLLTEKPGSEIGRYKLLSVLGEGGMGVVYFAEQKAPIRRRVALKVIKPGMDSKRVIARFEAERQALALLDHPNIAQVYDAGTTDSGRPYFVMEYVQGLPITEYCDQHKLSIEDRLTLFRQVCDGVQHAHQKGIIHRDIKPSNILVFAERDKAVPKIIDFGVAKAIAQPLTERTVFTEDTQLLGTPEYMSPEQADMASEDIDTRSDIYSLGVLLYVLLTGVLPFDSATFREGGIEQIRKVIRETDPKTPSTRLTKLGEEAKTVAENRRTQIGTLAKHLRRELEWIPLKAMRKERAERYRSASELADDIENYLSGAPLIAGPPSTVYRLKKFVRRNGVLSAAVLGVAVTLVLGLAGTTAMYLRSERALGDAQAITDFLSLHVLRAVTDANAYEQSVSFVLDAASKKLDEGIFKERPLVEASIRGELGWTYRLLGELDKAEQHSACALRICEEHLGEGHFQTTQMMFYLGLVYLAQNRWNDAHRMFSRQLQAVKREHPTEFHAPYISLGLLFRRMGQYKKAEECFLKKIEIVRRVKGEDRDARIASRFLAQVYRCQGRYKEAEQLCLKIMAIANWDPGVFLPVLYRDQGRYREAEQLFKALLEKQRTEAPRAERTVHPRIELASLYIEQGRYADANALFSEAHEIISRLPIEKQGYARWPWYAYELAVLRTRQGQFEEAENLFKVAQQALKQELVELADDHPDMLTVINGYGVLCREQQRYGEAESLLRQALEGRQRKLGDDHPACFESMHELAVLYKVQGKYDDAERLLLEAVEGRRLKLGDTHPHTIESLNSLIDLYEAWNKPEKAKAFRAHF